MNRIATIAFLVLVTLATIGLMVIQVYWIRDAVKLKQSIFAKDVKQAVEQVIFKIDK